LPFSAWIFLITPGNHVLKPLHRAITCWPLSSGTESALVWETRPELAKILSRSSLRT